MHLIQVVITFNNYTAENIAVLFTTENEKLNSISFSYVSLSQGFVLGTKDRF